MAWSKDETLKLLTIWSDENVQAQLEGCKRNQDVYRKISSELEEAGFNRTLQQCRDKLKKLKSEYRRVKDKQQHTGQGRYPEWEFFDVMDGVLGHKPATKPAVIMNTLGPEEEDLDAIPLSSPELVDRPTTFSAGETSYDPSLKGSEANFPTEAEKSSTHATSN